MCDYSLGGLPNRLAVEGEELVVHRFHTGSMGLASAMDLCTVERMGASSQNIFGRIFRDFFELFQDPCPMRAICVPPGALLIWKAFPVRLGRKWGMKATEAEIPEINVRFVQTSADVNRYRDALRLPNGREILLQNVPEGIRLQVSSLGGSESQEEQVMPSLVLAR